ATRRARNLANEMMDLANEMISELQIKLPGNHTHTQQILYEKRPVFCKNCWSIGHSEAKCQQMKQGIAPASKTNPPIWRPKRKPKNSVWQKVPPKDTVLKEISSTSVIHNTTDTHPNDISPCLGVQDHLANTSGGPVHGNIAMDPSCSTHTCLPDPPLCTKHNDMTDSHSSLSALLHRDRLLVCHEEFTQ
ncbi:hypothetical protein Dimus_005755, partial [Dionaea muscipula]